MISSHTRGLLMISITILLWGVLAIVLKYSLRFIGICTIIWFRFAFSCLFLAVYYAVRNPASFDILKRPPVLGIVAGLALCGNYYGFTVALDLTTPSNVQILIQLSPLLVAVIGVTYFKEELTRLQVLGFAVAAVGFVLFYWDQIQHLIISKTAYLTGNLWVLFSALSWAVYAVCQKILVRTWSPLQTNLLIYIVASLVFLPGVRFDEMAKISDGIVWAVMIFMGANTLVAYAALAESLRLLPANVVSAMIVLNPLITLAIAAELTRRKVGWMPAENMTLLGYVGALALLMGVGCVVKKH